MKIIIKRDSIGTFYSGHVSAYVISDDASERALYISFGDDSREPILEVDAASIPCDKSMYDDNLVTLTSTADFNRLKRALVASSYRNNRTYRSLDNNCVDAVYYVLKLAGITLTLDQSAHFKHLICLFYCPATTSTPAELMRAVKQYKVEELQAHGSFDRYHQLVKDITEVASIRGLRHSTDSFLEAVGRVVEERPHQLGHLITLLEKSQVLLLSPSTLATQELIDSLDLYTKQIDVNYIIYSIAFSALIMLSAMTAILASQFLHVNKEMQTLVASISVATFVMGTAMLIGSIVLPCTRLTTPLSVSVVDFSLSVEDYLNNLEVANESTALLSLSRVV